MQVFLFVQLNVTALLIHNIMILVYYFRLIYHSIEYLTNRLFLSDHYRIA